MNAARGVDLTRRHDELRRLARIGATARPHPSRSGRSAQPLSQMGEGRFFLDFKTLTHLPFGRGVAQTASAARGEVTPQRSRARGCLPSRRLEGDGAARCEPLDARGAGRGAPREDVAAPGMSILWAPSARLARVRWDDRQRLHVANKILRCVPRLRVNERPAHREPRGLRRAPRRPPATATGHARRWPPPAGSHRASIVDTRQESRGGCGPASSGRSVACG